MQLHLQNIGKSFGINNHGRTILHGISLTVDGGQFVSLLGPSGCGKTTLLTIIAGFQTACSGEVRLNGTKVAKPGPDRGFVFQDFALFPWMTVGDNILFPMRQQGLGKKERRQRLSQLLALAGLQGAEDLYPSQISGGMKQRTAVVRALASEPEVLLMDEPFGAVDYQMRHTLQEEFASLWLKRQKPVIMVTHDTEEAVYLSDRILVMSRNRGGIAHDLAIALPRPRLRDSSGYRSYVDNIANLLKNLHTKSERDKPASNKDHA